MLILFLERVLMNLFGFKVFRELITEMRSIVFKFSFLLFEYKKMITESNGVSEAFDCRFYNVL